MMKRLSYYDGYFYHHVEVYAQKYGARFLPIIHRSGSAPMIAGGEGKRPKWNEPSWTAPAFDMAREMGIGAPADAPTFATAGEAEAYAKAHADKTIGGYCRDNYYRP